MNTVLQAARRYLPRTVPLVGKSPQLAVGVGWPSWEATEASVTDWWRSHPDHNVGIRTGAGLVVLDVDSWDGGTETLAALEMEHGQLPVTPTVITGSGGRHLYFRGPARLRSRNLRSRDLAGLELKARGAQVAAPPSIHPDTGREYVWIRPLVEADLAELPAWLAELAGDGPRAAGTHPVVAGDEDPLRSIPATVYVPLLTGRTLDGAGNILCPFHQEVEPSLHCYEGDRGWYCFGCGRGGTIIDFGAATYGIEPRGRGFHDLRRRLAAELLVALS
jgi:Bifunctional DNA primase/polymerase, N-terminal/CHC2 zinc finger